MYKVRENVPLQIGGPIFSKTPVTLPKHLLIALGPEPPETLVAYDELAPSSKTDVSTVPNKTSEDQRTQTEWHLQMAKEDEWRKTHGCNNSYRSKTKLTDITIHLRKWKKNSKQCGLPVGTSQHRQKLDWTNVRARNDRASGSKLKKARRTRGGKDKNRPNVGNKGNWIDRNGIGLRNFVCTEERGLT